MSGTAGVLGTVSEGGRAVLTLARWQTPVATRRVLTADKLMAPPCEVVLPTLEKVPTEQRFSADDREVIALPEILVKSGIAAVEDWEKSGRDATKYLLLTLQRWIRDHGGASIQRRFDLDLILSDRPVDYSDERGLEGTLYLIVDPDGAALVVLNPAIELLGRVHPRLPAAFFRHFVGSLNRWVRVSEHELTAIGVVAQVQPVGDLAPIFCALGDGCSRRAGVDAPDHNVHAIEPPFSIQALRNPLPVHAPEKIQTVGENDRFVETDLRLTERLAHAVRRRDDVRIQQGDVYSLRMAVCQQCLMQVRQPSGDCASVPATPYNQHAHFVLQQFGMNMVCFHGFILHLFSRRIPGVFACCQPETSPGSGAFVPPSLTTSQESCRDELSVGQRHWDG